MKFLHTMVRVLDIQKSLDFYQEILGLKIDRTMELKGATLYFLRDGISDVEIELTHNHVVPDEGYELGSNFGHFAFEVDNMEDFTAKIQAAGVPYSREPFEIMPGLKIAFVNDPDGILIELIEKN